jgi:D-glycero-D-manno-heptose 1,7-bisphosphate phosphatase
MSAGRPAVFVDRDGVLNALVQRDGRSVSPRTVADFRIADDARAFAERLRSAGLLLFVFTNQPDLARKLMSESEHQRMMAELRRAVPLDDAAVCPHDDADGCDCRKPKPGMIHALATRWNVDLAASYAIGDSPKDIAAGRAAGCYTILLAPDGSPAAGADATAPTLSSTADLILSRHTAERAFA